MVADVILGNNIDTLMWIENLKMNSSNIIIVLDYDYYGEPNTDNGVIYLANIDAKEYLQKFDSVYFYKSMYVYPGMNGSMSSLYKMGKGIED